MFNNLNILLTGAGGFVGHHTLIHLLKTTDWNIVVTDSFKHYGTSARLRAVFEELPEANKRVKVITHDLSTPIDNITRNELGNINYIINMASQSHVDRSILTPRPFIENNIALSLTMLDYARTLDNLKCFIQVSTDEVYGPAGKGVLHEEWSTLLPSNPYSASKACQETIANSYWKTYNVPIVITNTMNIIGERQDSEKFVPMVIKKVLSDEVVNIHSSPSGEIGSRFYLHARNQADALLYILKNNFVKDSSFDRLEKINVVGEKEVSNLELAQIIAKFLNKPLKHKLVDFHTSRPGHDLRYALDGSKLSKMGWTIPVSFYESLEKTVLWTQNNKQWLL